MADNLAKCLCRIRSLSLTQSLNEHDRTKPTKASRTRSVSPPRTKALDWEEFCRIDEVDEDDLDENGVATAKKPWRWSLKEFLVRSISEGRGRARQKEMEREMLVQAALGADKKKKKKKKKPTSTSNRLGDYNSKKLGGRSPAISKKLRPLESATPHPRCTSEKACKVQRRCAVSAHERYYSANRARAQAEAEQLKKKTFLPYRKGLLGFLGPFQSSNSGTHHVPLSAS